MLPLLFLTSCAGTTGNHPAATRATASGQSPSDPQKIFVTMGNVRLVHPHTNLSGMTQFFYLETATQLAQSGRATVVSDELIKGAEAQGLIPVGAPTRAASHQLDVEVKGMREYSGTVKLGLFSSGQKYAALNLTLHLKNLQTGTVRSVDGSGTGNMGAWGVLAEVDKDALQKDKGYWKLKESMLGQAFRAALGEAINKL